MNNLFLAGLSKQRILVTGGTGSFGNFVVRRLLEHNPLEVRVLSRDEKKQYDMRVFYENKPNLTFVVGDIRDAHVVDDAMTGIDLVFQAAALKQVPTCERFPMEAIKTNVLGIENIVNSALAHKVKRVVAISTDKAVKPVNVMGMTKALQERLILGGNLSRSNQGTIFTCVRYGNVLRSRGSVVPFFRRQLAKNQVLTITDARMTRFLLTLNDAIDLVLFAAHDAQGGEIYVRKAPSGRITDIAKVICDELGKKFEYKLIGVLPGEKINEILVSEEEIERTEEAEQYYRVLPWWKAKQLNILTQEYSSANQLTDYQTIAQLIKRADLEHEKMEVSDAEFSKL